MDPPKLSHRLSLSQKSSVATQRGLTPSFLEAPYLPLPSLLASVQVDTVCWLYHFVIKLQAELTPSRRVSPLGGAKTEQSD